MDSFNNNIVSVFTKILDNAISELSPVSLEQALMITERELKSEGIFSEYINGLRKYISDKREENQK